jgi:branched-chain amino acid transport system substrate-binding protein
MHQAANLKHLKLGLLLEGIDINTTSEDFQPLKQFQMMKFVGESWQVLVLF